MSDDTFKRILINDDEIYEIGDFCDDMGKKLQDMIDDYLDLLKKINTDALMKGDPAEALNSFISYGEILKNVIKDTGDSIEDYAEEYVDLIDEKDSYLFE